MKRPNRLRIRTAWLSLAALWNFTLASAAAAGPTGEQVVAGQVSIAREGGQTTITASDQSVIQFNRFDIATGEGVRFLQPDERARVLNQILSNEPSRIDGSLTANGQVFLVNPAGVIFGQSAVVNVGGLIAAAGNFSTEDFLQNRDVFTQLSGPVENHGKIEAGVVALLGKKVLNTGTLRAPDGLVTLVAGDDLYLAQAGGKVIVKLENQGNALRVLDSGVENRGAILANEVDMVVGDGRYFAMGPDALVKGNDIEIAAQNGRVSLSGTLDASTTDAGARGGQISVRGDEILVRGATLDASGDAGGGRITVGGEAHGAGPSTATNLFIDSASTLKADALTQGNGGEVVAFARGQALVDGTISARGGAQGGDGGFVETSGLDYLRVTQTPDVSAPQGKGGAWLLDPRNIIIRLSEPNELSSDTAFGEDGVFRPRNEPSILGVNRINAALARGTVVIVDTSGPGEQAGDITQEADALIRGGSLASSLVLRAAGTITLNGGVTAQLAPLNLDLVAGAGIDIEAPIFFGSGGNLTLDAAAIGTGIVTLNGRISSSAALNFTVDAGQSVAIQAPISVFGGNLSINGGPGGISSSTGARIDAGTVNLSAALIALSGEVSASGSVAITSPRTTLFGGTSPRGVVSSGSVVVSGGLLELGANAGLVSGQTLDLSQLSSGISLFGEGGTNLLVGRTVLLANLRDDADLALRPGVQIFTGALGTGSIDIAGALALSGGGAGLPSEGLDLPAGVFDLGAFNPKGAITVGSFSAINGKFAGSSFLSRVGITTRSGDLSIANFDGVTTAQLFESAGALSIRGSSIVFLRESAGLVANGGSLSVTEGISSILFDDVSEGSFANRFEARDDLALAPLRIASFNTLARHDVSISAGGSVTLPEVHLSRERPGFFDRPPAQGTATISFDRSGNAAPSTIGSVIAESITVSSPGGSGELVALPSSRFRADNGALRLADGIESLTLRNDLEGDPRNSEPSFRGAGAVVLPALFADPGQRVFVSSSDSIQLRSASLTGSLLLSSSGSIEAGALSANGVSVFGGGDGLVRLTGEIVSTGAVSLSGTIQLGASISGASVFVSGNRLALGRGVNILSTQDLGLLSSETLLFGGAGEHRFTGTSVSIRNLGDAIPAGALSPNVFIESEQVRLTRVDIAGLLDVSVRDFVLAPFSVGESPISEPASLTAGGIRIVGNNSIGSSQRPSRLLALGPMVSRSGDISLSDFGRIQLAANVRSARGLFIDSTEDVSVHGSASLSALGGDLRVLDGVGQIGLRSGLEGAPDATQTLGSNETRFTNRFTATGNLALAPIARAVVPDGTNSGEDGITHDVSLSAGGAATLGTVNLTGLPGTTEAAGALTVSVGASGPSTLASATAESIRVSGSGGSNLSLAAGSTLNALNGSLDLAQGIGRIDVAGATNLFQATNGVALAAILGSTAASLNIIAGGNVQLQGGVNIGGRLGVQIASSPGIQSVVAGPLAASEISIVGGGDDVISLLGNARALAGDLTLAGSTVQLAGDALATGTLSVSANQLLLGAGTTLAAGSLLAINAPETQLLGAAGTNLFSATTVRLGNLRSAMGARNLRITTGALTAQTIDIGGGFQILLNGNTLGATSIAAGSIEISGPGRASGSAFSVPGTLLTRSGDLVISDFGSIQVAQSVSSAGALGLLNTNRVTLGAGASLSALGGDLNVLADVLQLDGTGESLLTASGSVSLAALTGAGSLRVLAGRSASLQSASVAGDLRVEIGRGQGGVVDQLQAGILSANNLTLLGASDDTLSLNGAITARNDAQLSAGAVQLRGDVTAAGSTSIAGDIDLAGAGLSEIRGNGAVSLGAISDSNGNSSLLVGSGGNVQLQSGANIGGSLTVQLTSSAGVQNVLAGPLAAGEISIVGGGDDVLSLLGRIEARAGAITLAGSSVQLGGSALATTSLSVSANELLLDAGAGLGAGTLLALDVAETRLLAGTGTYTFSAPSVRLGNLRSTTGTPGVSITTGALTAQTIDIGGGLEILLSNGTGLGATSIAAGSIRIAGPGRTSGAAFSVPSTLLARTGDLVISDFGSIQVASSVSAAGALRLLNASSVTLGAGATLTALGGDLNVLDGVGALQIDGAGESLLTASGNISLAALTGNGSLRVLAGRSASLQSASLGGDLRVEIGRGQGAVVDQLQAGILSANNVTLLGASDDTLSLNGAITARNDAQVTAGAVQLRGDVTAAGSTSIAGNIDLAGAGPTEIRGNGAVSLGAISDSNSNSSLLVGSGGSVQLQSGANIGGSLTVQLSSSPGVAQSVMAGPLAASGISIVGGGDDVLSLLGRLEARSGDITLAGSSVQLGDGALAAGNLSVSGSQLVLGSDASLSAGTLLAIDAIDTLLGSGAYTFSAPSVRFVNLRSVAAVPNVSIATGALSAQVIDIGGDLEILLSNGGGLDAVAIAARSIRIAGPGRASDAAFSVPSALLSTRGGDLVVSDFGSIQIGSTLQSGGALRLLNAGNVTLGASAFLSALGDLNVLDGVGALMLAGPAEKLLAAGGNASLAAVSGSGSLRVLGSRSVSLQSASVEGDLTVVIGGGGAGGSDRLQAGALSANNVTLFGAGDDVLNLTGNLTARSAAQLTAGTVQLGRDVALSGASLTVAAPQLVLLADGGTNRLTSNVIQLGNVSGAAGAGLLVQTSNLQLGTLDIAGGLDLQLSGASALAATSIAAGSIRIAGPGLASGTAFSVPATLLTRSGDLVVSDFGSISLASSLSSAGALRLLNTSRVTLGAGANLSALGGELNVLTGVGALELGGSGESLLSASGNVSLAALSGSGSARVTAGRSASLQSASLGGDLSVQVGAAQGAVADQLQAGALGANNVTLAAANDDTLSLNGAVSARNGARLNAGTVQLGGDVTSAGATSIAGNRIELGRDVDLSASSLTLAAPQLVLLGDGGTNRLISNVIQLGNVSGAAGADLLIQTNDIQLPSLDIDGDLSLMAGPSGSFNFQVGSARAEVISILGNGIAGSLQIVSGLTTTATAGNIVLNGIDTVSLGTGAQIVSAGSILAQAGRIELAGGATSFDAAGGILLPAILGRSSGSLSISTDGQIDLRGGVDIGGPLTLQLRSSPFTPTLLAGPLTASEISILGGNGRITLLDRVEARSGDVTLAGSAIRLDGNVLANRNLNVAASQLFLGTGAGLRAGTLLAIDAPETQLLASAGTNTFSAPTVRLGNLRSAAGASVSIVTGALSAQTIDIGGALDLQLSGAGALGATSIAAGSLQIRGPGLASGAALSLPFALLTRSGDLVVSDFGSIQVGSSLTSAGALRLLNASRVTLGAAASLSALGGDLNVLDGVGALELTGGGETVLSASGSAMLAALTSPGSLRVLAGRGASLQSASVAGDLRVEIGGAPGAFADQLQAGALSANNVTLSGAADDTLTLNGAVSARNDAQLNAGTVQLNGDLTSTGATSVAASRLELGRDVSLSGSSLALAAPQLILLGDGGTNRLVSNLIQLGNVSGAAGAGLLLQTSNLQIASADIAGGLSIVAGPSGSFGFPLGALRAASISIQGNGSAGALQLSDLIATAGDITLGGVDALSLGTGARLVSAGNLLAQVNRIELAGSGGLNEIRASNGAVSLAAILDTAGTNSLLIDGMQVQLPSASVGGSLTIGGGALELAGDLGAGGDLVLVSDASLTGSGAQMLLSTGGALVLAGDLTKTGGDLSLSAARIELGPTLASPFAPLRANPAAATVGDLFPNLTPGTTQQIVSVQGGALLLNAERVRDSVTAPTLISSGDLTLMSSGEIRMGTRERFVVNGDLALNGRGGVSVSDIAALGELSIDSGTGQIVLLNSSTSAGFGVAGGAAGANLVANSIRLTGMPVSATPLGPGQAALAATPNGLASFSGTLSPTLFAILNGDPRVASFATGTFAPFTFSDRAQPVPISEALVGLSPATLASTLGFGFTLPSADSQILLSRPLTTDEVLEWLECVLNEDCDPEEEGFDDPRLQTDEKKKLKELYTQAFGQDRQLSGGRALREVLAAFRARPDAADQVDGSALLGFLRSNPEESSAALRYLSELGALVAQWRVAQAGTDDVEPGAACMLSMGLRIEGIEASELYELVTSKPLQGRPRCR